MVAITATHSATPSLQAVLGRARVEQARQEADQAEAHAQNLRTQADAAEREAQQSRAKMRSLGTEAAAATVAAATEPTYSKDSSQRSPTVRIVNLQA